MLMPCMLEYELKLKCASDMCYRRGCCLPISVSYARRNRRAVHETTQAQLRQGHCNACWMSWRLQPSSGSVVTRCHRQAWQTTCRRTCHRLCERRSVFWQAETCRSTASRVTLSTLEPDDKGAGAALREAPQGRHVEASHFQRFSPSQAWLRNPGRPFRCRP